MQEQHAFPFLRETLLFLSLAGILIPTLQRLRINQVLGFLAVGALLGPFGLGLLATDIAWLGYLTFPRHEGVDALAELGVMFLMFMIGLELSAARLWALRRWVFGAGSAQVVISALLIGAVVYLLGHRTDRLHACDHRCGSQGCRRHHGRAHILFRFDSDRWRLEQWQPHCASGGACRKRHLQGPAGDDLQSRRAGREHQRIAGLQSGTRHRAAACHR